MCGIAGMVGLPYEEHIGDKMLQTMGRRGPDDQGIMKEKGCVLLHSRLAIVDIVGGKQPMSLCRAGECYTLVYNGELYNTEEVKKELIALGHIFHTHSDTEVILHAYAQWQEACLDRLNGIFGFAVWEHLGRRLFLARDRMGVKPLFYSLRDGGIVFASEIKTILAHPSVKPCLDREGAAQLILIGPGRIPGSGVLRDVYEIEPGQYGFFTNGKLEKKMYWHLMDGEHRDSFEETADKVRYLVTDAIKRQMVSDVPVGTFLSGGLDSSLISAVCAGEMQDRLNTFSVDYVDNEKNFVPGKFQPDADERYIALMCKHINSRHHKTLIGYQELAGTLQEATIARDLPGMADVDFSLLAFCKRVRKEVKVALSGECADEIFGGYPWYRDPQIRAVQGFPWAQNTNTRGSFLHPDIKKQIDPEEFVTEQYLSTLRRSHILPGTSGEERRIKEMVNLNQRWFMQTLLDRKDRMSMYCGLEVRVPFCDYRIAEYLYTVPWSYKEYQGREKGLLRYAMRDYLPEPVLNRKKNPYPKTWDPRYKKQMELALQVLLQDKNAPVFHILDYQAVKGLLESEYTWPWYGQLMGVPQTMAFILQIDFWMRHYQITVI